MGERRIVSKSMKDLPKNKFYCHDYWLKEEVTKLMRMLVEFIEQVYQVDVKLLTGKFVMNEDGQCIFIGAKDLFIDFPECSKYHKKMGGINLTLKQLSKIKEGKAIKRKQ